MGPLFPLGVRNRDHGRATLTEWRQALHRIDAPEILPEGRP